MKLQKKVACQLSERLTYNTLIFQQVRHFLSTNESRNIFTLVRYVDPAVVYNDSKVNSLIGKHAQV